MTAQTHGLLFETRGTAATAPTPSTRSLPARKGFEPDEHQSLAKGLMGYLKRKGIILLQHRSILALPSNGPFSVHAFYFEHARLHQKSTYSLGHFLMILSHTSHQSRLKYTIFISHCPFFFFSSTTLFQPVQSWVFGIFFFFNKQRK